MSGPNKYWFASALTLAVVLAGGVANMSFAQDNKSADTKLTVATAASDKDAAVAAQAGDDTEKIVEEAVEKGDAKLVEEAERVPGLSYDDISRLSNEIPGRVQIPDPTAKDPTSRAISVAGGLVSEQCKHFARGFVAKRLMANNPDMSQDQASAMVLDHLQSQRLAYAKVAGKEGLKRSDVAIHDAECPVCGPLNAAEIQCHRTAVLNSPLRELVMFDYGSNVLRGGHYSTINKIKGMLEEDPDLQVALIGRSSFPGEPVPNFALSSKRIASVWRGMTKSGIPVERIVAIPIGEDEPHIDLQLAIEYGLEQEFAALGEQPVNQSVYMVTFRPDGKLTEVSRAEVAELPPAPEVAAAEVAGTGEETASVQNPAKIRMDSVVRKVQELLNAKGYDVGTADGIFGPKTLAGLRQFKKDHGMEVNSRINSDVIAALSTGATQAQ